MTDTYVQRVGTTTDGDYMIVRVEVRTHAGTSETVDHGQTTDPTEVSFVGELWKRGTDPKRHEPLGCGQNLGDLRAIVTPAPGWTLEEVTELAEQWERWHLNTMRAACAHMDTALLAREDDGYGGTRISSRDPRNACPVTGYMWGHAWLTEELPADVLDRVRHLMRDRSAALHKARGYDMHGKRV